MLECHTDDFVPPQIKLLALNTPPLSKFGTPQVPPPLSEKNYAHFVDVSSMGINRNQASNMGGKAKKHAMAERDEVSSPLCLKNQGVHGGCNGLGYLLHDLGHTEGVKHGH